MNLMEIQQTLTPFDTSSTGVSQYDNWLRNPNLAKQEGFDVELKNLTTRQYIDACCYGFKCTISQLQQRNDMNKVQQYAQAMKKGDKFPTPTLQFVKGGGFTQEGIHRVLAAELLNIQTIPVLVILEQ